MVNTACCKFVRRASPLKFIVVRIVSETENMKLEWLVIASKHIAVNMCQAFVHTARHGMNLVGTSSFYFYGLYVKLVSLMVFIARGVKYVLETNLILQLELDVTFLVIDRF